MLARLNIKIRGVIIALLGILYFAIGIVGFRLTEMQTSWDRAVQWTINFLTTPGSDFPPTNSISSWFQTGFAGLNFLFLTLALATIVIPPMLNLSASFRNGQRRYWHLGNPLRHKLFLIVSPVDWEKVRSVVDALHGRYGPNIKICVAGNLDDLPSDITLVYVKGNLRALDTYIRAGIKHAYKVLICASSYDNPEQDNQAAAIATLIQRIHPEASITAEQVSHRNDDLFSRVKTVIFDPVTLSAVVRCIKEKMGSTVQLVVDTVDEEQRSELMLQLKEQGVVLDETGERVKIVLPGSLDDTDTDFRVWSEMMREGDNGRVVTLFLSVTSKELFHEEENTICADEAIAKALVWA